MGTAIWEEVEDDNDRLTSTGGADPLNVWK